jgi:hypothetical protein
MTRILFVALALGLFTVSLTGCRAEVDTRTGGNIVAPR